MDQIRCRLCASVGDLLLPIDESLGSKILSLFQLRIGGPDERLSCCICNSCCDTVNSTWIFAEGVRRAQLELVEILTRKNAQIISDCVMGTGELNGGGNLNEAADLNDARELTSAGDINDDSDLNGADLLDDSQMFVSCKEVLGEDKTSGAKGKKVKKTKGLKKVSEQDEVLHGVSDCEQNEDGSLNFPACEVLPGWENYPWVCCECGLHTNNSEELKEHYYVVHGQTNRFACVDCPKIYTKYNMFLAHIRIHRPNLRFSCDICNKWFTTVRQTETHRAEHGYGDGRPYECDTCGKNFRMQSTLLAHSRSHLPAELKNKYACDQCPKKFGTKPNLTAHKRIHAGVKDFTCDQCGKSFVQKGNLDNHLLTHSAVRPFICATCGKSFKTLVRLKKHGSVHSGLKPHQCDVCGRQFREKGTLKEHHRIHTGAMPFSCDYCGKSFRFKGVLTTHRRQHTGERPYSCLECQHHFTNWPNYNKHMKRRHGINTSVTTRKPQQIPPTGMPQRNPPGSVLAPPQMPDNPFPTENHPYYLNMYNISEDMLQQRTVQ